MTWEVTSVGVGDDAVLEERLAQGWEPFAVQRLTMWLRREKRWVQSGDRVDPSATCSACGEKLGHGHADDCPRTPTVVEPVA